jgi:hypothetical protein
MIFIGFQFLGLWNWRVQGSGVTSDRPEGKLIFLIHPHQYGREDTIFNQGQRNIVPSEKIRVRSRLVTNTQILQIFAMESIHGHSMHLFCSTVRVTIQPNSSRTQEAEAKVDAPIARGKPEPTSRTQVPRGVDPTPAA